MRVLIVEDSKSVSRALEESLREVTGEIPISVMTFKRV